MVMNCLWWSCEPWVLFCDFWNDAHCQLLAYTWDSMVSKLSFHCSDQLDSHGFSGEMACDTTFSTFFPLQGNIADGALAATLKYCDNCGNLVVLFTCSCCVFLAGWLMNVVALSQLLWRLWPLRIVWLSWAVLSLCLFPVTVTSLKGHLTLNWQ